VIMSIARRGNSESRVIILLLGFGALLLGMGKSFPPRKLMPHI
jgi:hypothetical protein